MERTGIDWKSRHGNNTIRFVLSERVYAAPRPRNTLAAKYLSLMVHKEAIVAVPSAMSCARFACHDADVLAIDRRCFNFPPTESLVKRLLIRRVKVEDFDAMCCASTKAFSNQR